MAGIKVYRYDYYDRVLKCDRRSVDYATGDAIMEMRGTILVETQRQVDESRIAKDGTIRAVQVFVEPAASSDKRRHEPRRPA